eukprot:11225216-Lingulodinium_polyedra.AAC.1
MSSAVMGRQHEHHASPGPVSVFGRQAVSIAMLPHWQQRWPWTLSRRPRRPAVPGAPSSEQFEDV